MKALLIAGLLYFVFVSIWAVAELQGKQSVVAVMMDTKDLTPVPQIHRHTPKSIVCRRPSTASL